MRIDYVASLSYNSHDLKSLKHIDEIPVIFYRLGVS